MARASYGNETKKRSLRLLAALLAYANEELDCNEAGLDALRPQIQTRWQSENRLVVRTKVRYLLLLTGLQSTETPLNAEQIKEALQTLCRFFRKFWKIIVQLVVVRKIGTLLSIFGAIATIYKGIYNSLTLCGKVGVLRRREDRGDKGEV